METDDCPRNQCEPHLERQDVSVAAVHVVNDEPMCAPCFAGAAIFAFEKIGDTERDVESGEQRRR